MSQMGTIAGKTIKVYDPKHVGTKVDLILFFKKFHRLQVLRALSDVDKYRIELRNAIHSEIVESVIRYCILLAIKHCSPVKTGKTFTFSDLLYVYDIAYALKFKDIMDYDPTPEEAIIILAYEQFPSQSMMFLNLNRTFYLYQDAWEKYDVENKIDLNNNIRGIVGCNFQLIILLTYQILGNKNNYFYNLNRKTIDAFKSGFRGIYTYEEHVKYLKWVSACYGEYINKGIYSILQKPILKTNDNPKSSSGKVYLLLSSYALINKLTDGIYFELSEKYASDDRNLFKTIYGLVFERYVEELLRYYLDSSSIEPEIEFINFEKEKDKSCDFIIKLDDSLLLIEVKQSSIFTKSKLTGNEIDIANNIKNTLVKAGKQLNKTYFAIKNKIKEFEKYWNFKKIYGLIVCGDHLYYANSLIKNILDDNIEFKILYNIINIDEIEILLDAQKKNKDFVSIIISKLLENNNFDYMEYIKEIFPDHKNDCEFLKNKAKEIEMMIEKLVIENSK